MLAVPCPEVIVTPDGTVHTKVLAPIGGVTLYVADPEPTNEHTVNGPLMAIGRGDPPDGGSDSCKEVC